MSEKWDNRFIELAKHVSSWSKDPAKKTGAVLIREDRTLASMGYNGFARKIKDNGRLLFTREAKLQRTIHAEMNAILSYPGHVQGFTLYLWPLLPCSDCAKHIIQAGILRVVAPPIKPKSKWTKSINLSKSLFEEAGVIWKEHYLGD